MTLKKLSGTLDLQKSGDALVWDVGHYSWAKAQAAVGNQFAGWQTGVVTLQVTLDGSNWEAIGNSGITFSADGMSGPFDLRDAKLRAIVTTTASGAAQVTVTLLAMERTQ